QHGCQWRATAREPRKLSRSLMATDQVVKFAIELWLFTLVVLMGSGLGTVCVRVWRLPAYYWLPLTLASAGLVSYGLFWVFLFDPHAGRVAAVACGCASAAAFGWQLWSPS